LKMIKTTSLNIKSLLTLSVAFSLFPLFPACAPSGSTISPPLSQSKSGIVVKLSLEELIIRADLVLLGEVVSIASRQENNGNINTQVILSVKQTLKGLHTNEVTITVPGGTVGGQTQASEDAVRFLIGEKVVVFLEQVGESLYVFGGFQGKFTVDENNNVNNTPVSQFIEQIKNATAKPREGEI